MYRYNRPVNSCTAYIYAFDFLFRRTFYVHVTFIYLSNKSCTVHTGFILNFPFLLQDMHHLIYFRSSDIICFIMSWTWCPIIYTINDALPVTPR